MFDECVYGCPRICHRPTQMSVPLKPNPKPLYKVPTDKAYNSVTYTWPNSKYERDECLCGCCYYEPDNCTV